MISSSFAARRVAGGWEPSMPLLHPITQEHVPIPLRPSQAPKSAPPRTNQASQRLPLNPQEDDAANLQRIASASAEIQAILCNPSRPWSQPRDQQTRTARGSGGKRFSFPPRRLSAAFDGRKRPPSHNKDKKHKEPNSHAPAKKVKKPLAKPEHMCYTKHEQEFSKPPRRKGNKPPQPPGTSHTGPCPGRRAEPAGAERGRPWGEGGQAGAERRPVRAQA